MSQPCSTSYSTPAWHGSQAAVLSSHTPCPAAALASAVLFLPSRSTHPSASAQHRPPHVLGTGSICVLSSFAKLSQAYADYSLWAGRSPPPFFINKVFIGTQPHLHSQIFLSGPFQKVCCPWSQLSKMITYYFW